MPESIVTRDPGRYLHIPMSTLECIPPSEPDTHPPSELDTHGASPPGSLPVRVSSSIWDYFEDPCLSTNQSYYNGNLDTTDSFQNDLPRSSVSQNDIQEALSPQMPFTLLGLEGYVLDGKDCLREEQTNQ
jgi:hypothetical protein